jgi:MinD-like ATPase involved in chromosome partitioning or flagellar assembly/CheY-like chemotaxis protein
MTTPLPPAILVIENDPAALIYVSALLTKAGYRTFTAPSGKEGLIEAWRNRPDMIILDPALPDLNGLELTKRLRADARTAQTQIVLLGASSLPQDILAAVQSGASEYIIKRPGADTDLLDRVQALLPAQAGGAMQAATRPAARLVSFLSAKGGTGTSSMCANIAHIVAKLSAPKTVAVVDLVLPIGSIAQIVGVDPSAARTIITATRLEPQLITPDKMKELLTPAEAWKFHLLPGAPDPDTAQDLWVERLEAVFGALRQAFDYVFVDFGRALSRVSLPIIRSSARVVLVLSADASSVALSKTTLKYLESHGLRRNQIYPILNRAVGLEGMSRAEMEKELALSIPSVVPHMGGAFALANNQHLPITSKFQNDTATFVLHDLSVGLMNQLEEGAPQVMAA